MLFPAARRSKASRRLKNTPCLLSTTFRAGRAPTRSGSPPCRVGSRVQRGQLVPSAAAEITTWPRNVNPSAGTEDTCNDSNQLRSHENSSRIPEQHAGVYSDVLFWCAGLDSLYVVRVPQHATSRLRRSSSPSLATSEIKMFPQKLVGRRFMSVRISQTTARKQVFPMSPQLHRLFYFTDSSLSPTLGKQQQ